MFLWPSILVYWTMILCRTFNIPPYHTLTTTTETTATTSNISNGNTKEQNDGLMVMMVETTTPTASCHNNLLTRIHFERYHLSRHYHHHQQNDDDDNDILKLMMDIIVPAPISGEEMVEEQLYEQQKCMSSLPFLLLSPGMHLNICDPSLSQYQYHPFAISQMVMDKRILQSSSSNKMMMTICFHIKMRGDWTRSFVDQWVPTTTSTTASIATPTTAPTWSLITETTTPWKTKAPSESIP